MQQDIATTRSIEGRAGPVLMVGLDVGDRYTYIYALGTDGEVVRERRVRTTELALSGALEDLSPWLSRVVADLGHEVVVANPRQVALIARSHRKTDRLDAAWLARLGRLDPELCEAHPETAALRQVTGVGPITALTFVLTIEDPGRFPKNREVGAYLGLVPRQRDSGERAPQLGISKSGDPGLRRLLVQARTTSSVPSGPIPTCAAGMNATREREQGARRSEQSWPSRGGWRCLLLALWKTGGVYEPLRHATAAATEAA